VKLYIHIIMMIIVKTLIDSRKVAQFPLKYREINLKLKLK